MPSRLSTRLSVFLASAAVAAATLVPVLPAAAEETPPPTPPVVEPVETPTPVVEPVETPTPEADPIPEVETPTTAIVVGQFVELEGHGLEPLPEGVRYFSTADGGMLLDTSVIGEVDGALNLTVEVPEGVDPDDAKALVDSSVYDAPLVVVSVQAGRQSASMVNQTPNTSATHQVYAVLITPSNVTGTVAHASQTEAKVQASVAHSDGYWNQQSSGTIRFALAGTTTWVKGTSTCSTEAGSIALWNQAAALATTQLGYKVAPNNHLALFFPSNSDCNGALGFGSIGYSVNAGGESWSIGTETPREFATLAHELGHNLSLGHADWLKCTSAIALTNCTVNEYGDLTDVMGFGQVGHSGGALSAPQAIRASIWSSSAWKFAPKGTTTYKLLPVSGNTGLRSVVVEDSLGIDYFVEFRNYTGEDSREGLAVSPCTGNSCSSTTPGVRILMLDTRDNTLGFKGEPGDGSRVISRSTTDIDFVKNESFSINGVTIKVTALSTSSATVSVTRNFTKGQYGTASMTPGVAYDQVISKLPYASLTKRVGDSWGLLITENWIGDSRSFQWYRDGKAITGATKQYYTFTNADYLKTVTVRVTFKSKGYSNYVANYSAGVIQKAVASTGTVTIPAATPRKAVLANFPWGTTFAYQWYRAGAPIKGATSATFSPTSADVGKLVHLVVTPTSAGNAMSPIVTAGKDYGLVASSTPSIGGTAKVGTTLSVPNVSYSTPTDGAITVNRSYVWYRSGVAIKGATAASYALVAADLGKTITVKVTASAPGYVSRAFTTPATAKVVAGTIAGTHAVPTLSSTISGTTVKWAGALPSGSVTEPGVTVKYQWYRSAISGTGAAAISKATASSYTLTSADANKLVWLRVTVSKSGYATVPLESAKRATSLTVTGAPVITGSVKTLSALGVTAPTYQYTGSVTPTFAYQWYADGKAVAGATAASFTAPATLKGKAITVKVTAFHQSGGLHILPLALTSAATQKLGTEAMAGTLTGTFALTQVGMVLSLPTIADTGVTESGVTPAYQWYRSGAAISKATKSSYTLTSADAGKLISLRVVLTKPNYTNVVKFSHAVNYTIVANPTAPVISDGGLGYKVGTVLSIAPRTYTGPAGAISPTLTRVWYRNGVAIPGATGATYKLVPADLGKKITVKVSAALELHLGSAATSASTPTIAVGTIAAEDQAPLVSQSGTANGLQLYATYYGNITDPLPGVTVSYEWLRGGTVIAGATTNTYLPTAADNGQNLQVRAVLKATGYETRKLTLGASAMYPRVVGSGAAAVSDTTPVVGQTLSVAGTLSYTLSGSATPYTPAAGMVSYQWYVNGAAVSTAKSATFKVPSSAKGKTVSVRVTVGASGYTPTASTSPVSSKVK